MTDQKTSVFETLSKVDISDHVNKKMGLDYLSWSWAWSKLKSIYPNTPVPEPTLYQEMILTKNGYELTDRKVPYLTTPTGTMVQVTVLIEGEPYTQSLYVMDNRNKTVINPQQNLINKTLQRCTVKAIAMAGLGLNLYANEDLPMGDINSHDQQQAERKAANNQQQKKQNPLQRLAAEYKQKLQTAVQATGRTEKSIQKNVVDTCKSDVKGYAEFDKQQQLTQWIKVLDRIIQDAAQVDMFAENN